MRNINYVLIVMLIALLVTIPASATTYYVDDDGGYDYTSIDAAMSAASSGDTIYVYNGTYGMFDFTKSNITVIGEGADVVIVSGGDYIDFESVSQGSVLDGITVSSATHGAWTKAPNVVIRNCVFDGLTADEALQITTDNCLFENNVVSNATGAYCAFNINSADNCKIVNNTFINNAASAVTMYEGDNTTIAYNTFISNGWCGIEFYNAVGTSTIYGNNFIDNYATTTTSGTPAPALTYWNSTEPIGYIYNGSTHIGYLGNFWDTDYTGIDSSPVDGIGDTSYSVPDSLGVDYVPLIAGVENYQLLESVFADLVVTEFITDSLVAEQPNRLRVRIANNGGNASEECDVLLQNDTGYTLDNRTLGSINSGNSSVIAFTILLPAGLHNLTVVVDSSNVIAESNETNNNCTTAISAENVSIDENWFQFHKDVQHTGFYPGDAPDTNATLWVSDDINAVTDSSTVIAEGIVFVNVNGTGMSGGNGSDSEVIGLNAYTSEVVGSYGLGSFVYGSWATPCYYNGNVSCTHNQDAVNGGDLAVNGKIYCGDYDGNHLHCYYESNGTEYWSVEIGKTQACPAYSDGKIYVTGMPHGYMDYGEVFCLDAETGEEIWKIAVDYDTDGSPSIYNDILYLTTYNWEGNGSIYAIDKEDGTIIWRREIQRSDSTPAFAYGNVYVSGGCVGYSQIQTYCFDAVSGELVWSTPASWSGLGGWTQSPLIADGKVYLGKLSGSFGYDGTYCLDAFTGETLWSYPAGGASPSIYEGILYTIGNDGKVYAFGNASYDWNPWNDLDSDIGRKISTDELQYGIYCWLNNVSAPGTGAEVTEARMDALAFYWVTDLDMPEGTESAPIITVNRTISSYNVTPNNPFMVTVNMSVEIPPDQYLTSLVLDEDLPSGWNVTASAIDGWTFDNSTVRWSYSSTLLSGANFTFEYNVTPPVLIGGVYNVSGIVSATELFDTEVGGDSEVYLRDDWNPWNDRDSEDGAKISSREIQAAVKCWLNESPAPRTGAEITDSRKDALVDYWVNDSEMPTGAE